MAMRVTDADGSTPGKGGRRSKEANDRRMLRIASSAKATAASKPLWSMLRRSMGDKSGSGAGGSITSGSSTTWRGRPRPGSGRRGGGSPSRNGASVVKPNGRRLARWWLTSTATPSRQNRSSSAAVFFTAIPSALPSEVAETSGRGHDVDGDAGAGGAALASNLAPRGKPRALQRHQQLQAVLRLIRHGIEEYRQPGRQGPGHVGAQERGPQQRTEHPEDALTSPMGSRRPGTAALESGMHPAAAGDERRRAGGDGQGLLGRLAVDGSSPARGVQPRTVEHGRQQGMARERVVEARNRGAGTRNRGQQLRGFPRPLWLYRQRGFAREFNHRRSRIVGRRIVEQAGGQLVRRRQSVGEVDRQRLR